MVDVHTRPQVTTLVDIDSSDPSITYGCLSSSLEPVWVCWTDQRLHGGSEMSTAGNWCYAELTFHGTGIWVMGTVGPDRGPFSCALDSSTPTWFTGWSAFTQFNKTLCYATNLQNRQHTIRVTNGPLPGWNLDIDWLQVETQDTTFHSESPAMNSDLDGYVMPSYLHPQNLVPPCLAQKRVIIGVSTSLGLAAVIASALAVLFYVKWKIPHWNNQPVDLDPAGIQQTPKIEPYFLPQSPIVSNTFTIIDPSSLGPIVPLPSPAVSVRPPLHQELGSSDSANASISGVAAPPYEQQQRKA